MRKGRFSEEQMVAVIREGDRDPVAAVAKRHGISEQTIYTWRKRFGALQANDVKRLRQLEAENARLKKLVAERDLEIEVMKEVAAKKMVSVPARRQQVPYGPGAWALGAAACTLFSVARLTLKYRSRKATKDAPVVERMTELSAQYPRYGYRRIRIFLDLDGHAMSPGRALSIGVELGPPQITSAANVTLVAPLVLTIRRRVIDEPDGFRGSLDGRGCGRFGPSIARAVHRPGQWGSVRLGDKRFLSNELRHPKGTL